MNDEEIRALVRAAIQKHMAGGVPLLEPMPSAPVAVVAASSLSFGQYALAREADDTMCLIEPAVRCTHCGYCKCHGH
jgi:hypothetical protein